MKNRDRGKRAERAAAKLLGGERRGVLGGEDISHPLWSVQVKSRKSFVAVNWMQQSVKDCSPNKTPLLVIHVQGQRHSGDFVMMRMADFIDQFGEIIKPRWTNEKLDDLIEKVRKS